MASQFRRIASRVLDARWNPSGAAYLKSSRYLHMNESGLIDGSVLPQGSCFGSRSKVNPFMIMCEFRLQHCLSVVTDDGMLGEDTVLQFQSAPAFASEIMHSVQHDLSEFLSKNEGNVAAVFDTGCVRRRKKPLRPKMSAMDRGTVRCWPALALSLHLIREVVKKSTRRAKRLLLKAFSEEPKRKQM
jgi:hypothetical protein